MKFDGEWYIAWYIFIGRKFRQTWNDRELRRLVTRARGFVILILMWPILCGRNNFGFIPSTCPDVVVGAIEQRSHRSLPVGVGHASISANFSNSRNSPACSLSSSAITSFPRLIRRIALSLCFVLSSSNHKSLTSSRWCLGFLFFSVTHARMNFPRKLDFWILILANARCAFRVSQRVFIVVSLIKCVGGNNNSLFAIVYSFNDHQVVHGAATNYIASVRHRKGTHRVKKWKMKWTWTMR